MLQIGVLGEVRASRDGADIDLGGPRQRAVLAMLVAAGQGRLVSADRFVEDLWAGEPPPKAMAALHAYVSRLRRALEPERGRRRPATVIMSAPPGYRLDLPTDSVDTWRYEAMVAAARREADPAKLASLIEDAEALWRGEPFAAYADLDWVRPVAESLEELRAGALELRAGALLALGRTGPAIAALRVQTQRYPLREQAVELLATGLYRDGRQGEALAAIARIRRDLAEELGVDPSPRLRALEADILSHADHLAAPTPSRSTLAAPPRAPRDDGQVSPSSSTTPASTDLAGRGAELRRLLTCAETTASRNAAGVAWVTGEAGIGKSALVERLAELVSDDTVGARGRCPEVDGAPPGWSWTQVLRALDAGAAQTYAGTSTGTSTQAEVPSPADGGSAFTLVRTVEASLAAHAGRPVLVVLEDLHRADEETLQILRHLISTVQHPLLLVSTFRDDSMSPALGATLAAVAERTLDRVALVGLDTAAAREILERYGRRDLASSTASELVARSGGNPLFLREIGQLVAAEGPEAGLAVPPVIRELLTRRIDRLPAPVSELLSRAAVLGRDIDLDLLITVEHDRGGLDEDEVMDALDVGLVAGLLDLPAPGALRFVHALTRDTLHERLAPLRRLRLHRDVLGVLERDHSDRIDALAHHAAAGLDARTASRAAVHLEAAAHSALAIGVHADAVRHA